MLLLSCEEKMEDMDPGSYEIVAPDNPQPQGDRLFGINISESKNGFGPSYEIVKEAGIDIVELNIPWNAFEPEAGVYTDPSGLLQAIAVYGNDGISVSLSIAVINTVAWEVPPYLENVSPDTEQFISAFIDMLTWVMGKVPENVNLESISIGNEVNLVLDGEQAWSSYTAFYEEAVDRAHVKFPDLKIGVKTTAYAGLFAGEQSEIQAINSYSDVIMLNYYPQDHQFRVYDPAIVHDDFNKLTALFPNREIRLMEVGYQSGSEYVNSSEVKQARFFHEMFTAWDDHRDQIKLILINWLHDQSPQTIEEWKDYYGDDPALVEYLSTLGLRNYDGTDKPAWLQIKTEANARGWD